MNMRETLRIKLEELADEKYKEFHKSLVPGLTNMLGVRMPKVREVAKWAAKQEWQSEWEELGTSYGGEIGACYEELMIKGILIGYGKLNQEEQAGYLKKYVPLINNWGICDCCCSTWKFMKKDQEYWFTFLQPYLESENEFEVRFAVVSMLDHFVNDTYLERLFQAFDSIKHEGYYVKMAVAWAVSICYIKYPEATWEYLERKSLDDFTHNKTIQKIRESYRISKEEKDRLLELKVNTK